MFGRWHGMDATGFAISETNDAKASIYGYLNGPADVLNSTVVPCAQDAEAGEVMASLIKR
jgi:hypothetical protein